MVSFRTFRNTDPPGLAAVWNDAFVGRGEVRLRHSSPLEGYVFAKPYFDPAGLIVASEDGATIGFAHAGFGPNEARTALCRDNGVICILAVRPSHRKHGIGAELLRRAEAYLIGNGSKNIYAGPKAPLAPFYFGLYGGSDMPGFLESNGDATGFLSTHGYAIHDSALVLNRFLNHPVDVADGRFAALRRRFDVRITPRTGPGDWWQECTQGPVEIVEFRLEDKSTTEVFARAAVWEMDGFSMRWNHPAVGIVVLDVREEARHQGLAKFLITQMLRYLQEQYFGLVEVQIGDQNELAMKLYQNLGFQVVDIGRRYIKKV